MKSLRFPLILLVALTLGTSSAQASMINLTYSGVNEEIPAITALGSGSFRFATGTTSLTLGSLTAFSFNQTTTVPDVGLPGFGSFTYGLADLVSFSATLSATGTVTALSFRTGYQDASNGFLNPQYFKVSSLSQGGATLTQDGRDGDVTTGTLVATLAMAAVPEPSSLCLCGLAGVIGVVARRRIGGHPARN